VLQRNKKSRQILHEDGDPCALILSKEETWHSRHLPLLFADNILKSARKMLICCSEFHHQVATQNTFLCSNESRKVNWKFDPNPVSKLDHRPALRMAPVASQVHGSIQASLERKNTHNVTVKAI